MDQKSNKMTASNQKFGEYKLVRVRGSGATGYVYQANKNDQRVAVKIYKDWLFERNPAAQDKRIARETKLRDIKHPNICRVYAHGKVALQGVVRRYVAMEFIDGESMEKIIRESGALDWPQFKAFAIPLVEAVQALHTKRFIHRDIKPANIMIETDTKRVVLTDFGVVGQIPATTTLTLSHEFLGTLAYSPPEWIFRDTPSSNRSPSLDIYSLGATFFEMLTGTRLFAELRNAYQIAEAVRERLPAVRAPHYPTRVLHLIRAMLAKRGNARPTLGECRNALRSADQILSAKTVANCDVFGRPRTERRRRRERLYLQQYYERREQARVWSEPVKEEFKVAQDRLVKYWFPRYREMTRELSLETPKHWAGTVMSSEMGYDNSYDLLTVFPDRQWNCGVSFWLGVEAAKQPGYIVSFKSFNSVEVFYYFEGNQRYAAITRLIAIHGPKPHIDLDLFESWEGPLQAILPSVMADRDHACHLMRTAYLKAGKKM